MVNLNSRSIALCSGLSRFEPGPPHVVDTVIEMDDPSALLLALRQVAKTHDMAEVARPKSAT